MFSVYKITNLINNKSYIGSSIRVEKRWRDHINASQNPNSKRYNYPLYQAFRKYGLENFSFQVIKDDFDTIKEMTDYEKEMIIYYDTYNKNGYNQTLFTDRNENAIHNINEYTKKISQKCAKVDLNNNILETYSSYHQAAKMNSYDADYYASRIRSVCKGVSASFNNMFFRDLDNNGNVISQEFKRSHGKKAIIGIKLSNPEEEIYFESISEAAREINSDRQSIGKCIQGDRRYSNVHGYVFRELDIYGNIIDIPELPYEEIINDYQKRHPVINGEQHSISEWCEIYNIKVGTVNYRLRKGMDPIKAITTPARR